MLSVAMVMNQENSSELCADCERGVVPPFDELWDFLQLAEPCGSGREPLARHCAVYH